MPNNPIDLDELEEIANEHAYLRDLRGAGVIREAIAELAAHRKSSTWTSEKPTGPGWYWVRDEFDRRVGQAGAVLYLGLGDKNGELRTSGGKGLGPDWDYSPILEPARSPAASEGSE
jgi:hypothetical protein